MSFGLCLALLTASCGKKQDNQNEIIATKDPNLIVGGKEATRKMPGASSVVMITGESEDGSSFICTGTLISKRDVLTAAHCISPHLSSMSVVFELKPFEGDHDPVTLNIQKAFRHSDAQDPQAKLRNDLGWIRLQGDLPAGARPARLNLEQDLDPKDKEPLLVLGYGRTSGLESADAADLRGAGVLRSAWVQIQKSASDGKTFSILQKAGKGVCSGDSGGPAYRTSDREPVLMGVASAVDRIQNDPSAPEDICQNQSIFTNLNRYRDWIQSSLADQ